MNKKMYIFTMIFLGIVMCLILIVIAMMTIPVKALTFEDDKFPITSHEIKPGGIVEYAVKGTKHNDLPATVGRQLINSYIYNYTQVVGNLPIGSFDKKVQLNIPEYAESGIYFVRITYTYQVNPFRKEVIVKDTETFMVIK